MNFAATLAPKRKKVLGRDTGVLFPPPALVGWIPGGQVRAVVSNTEVSPGLIHNVKRECQETLRSRKRLGRAICNDGYSVSLWDSEENLPRNVKYPPAKQILRAVPFSSHL